MSLFIEKDKPAVVLAPMEGVTEAPMRELLTEIGGYNYCVSEFFRISQSIPSTRAILDHIPELAHPAPNQSKTKSGTPVQVQLLGGDAEKLAEAALRAVQAGAQGVDLNFGCPAPTVNRHDGGATLLKYPHRIEEIVGAVRKALPSHIAVSAKLRLGFDDPKSIHENAARAQAGGASWITIHGRTKVQGYTQPAYWGPIGEVRRALAIPVIANGEIWTLDDFKRCRDVTGCDHFMLGRSALADPRLALQISRELGIKENFARTKWVTEYEVDWPVLMKRFVDVSLPYTKHMRYSIARIKQWARMIHISNELDWYEPIKRLQSVDEILAEIAKNPVPIPRSMIKSI